MIPSRWKEIDALMDRALELAPEKRRDFVDAETAGDDELRTAVIELLEAHEAADTFMPRSAMGIAAESLASAKTEESRNLLNKRIATYQIKRQLGAGGMGEVYLAFDDKLKRNVALKILPAEYGTNDERVKRFQVEARVISRLNHPGIVTIYDIGSFEGVNYIATELVEGKTLRDLIGGKFKLRNILANSIQICDALSAAHNEGIVHRDIKPENVMIRKDGYAKILDFGLAKLSEVGIETMGSIAKTRQGIIIGTPAYMSPSQISDDTIDHRTDLWSCGVVLYEFLTGVNPFRGPGRKETFQAILSTMPPPPSSINPEVPPELDRIILKLLEKDPAMGYQTAADLRADLKRIKREIDSEPWSGDSSLPYYHRPAARRQWIWGIGGVMALLAGLAAYTYFADNAAPSGVEWARGENSQLTDSPEVEGYPSLSPDGSTIIYESGPVGARDIFSQRVGGKNAVNLTSNSPASDSMPAFSADGKMIAFRSEREPAGIYVMEATGENPRRVSDVGYHPSWSPDGTKLVVSSRSVGVHTAHVTPGSKLFVIDVETAEVQELEVGPDAIMPSWSPNGRRIAFWYVRQGEQGEIATVPVTGGTPKTIAMDPASDWNPVWAPNGRHLYFGSNRGGNMSILRVPIDEITGDETGPVETVPSPSRYSRHISFSRDGRHLAYVRYESKSNLQALDFDPVSMSVKGDVRWITQGNNEISGPDLSPDGKRFLARKPTNTQEDLVIFDLDGGNPVDLMNDRYRERAARWSPDGRSIAFQSDREGKFQIWMVNADGSGLRKLTSTDAAAAVSPVFSPDGRQLVYSESHPGGYRPYMLDLHSGAAPKAVELNAEDLSFVARDWSPDGKYLLGTAFDRSENERGIGILDVASGEYRAVGPAGSSPFWLSNGRNFIFTARDTIYLGDIAGGPVKELYSPPAYELQQANISADDRLIFFRYLQVDADVWMIDAPPSEN